jgi:hypothetical protein
MGEIMIPFEPDEAYETRIAMEDSTAIVNSGIQEALNVLQTYLDMFEREETLTEFLERNELI